MAALGGDEEKTTPESDIASIIQQIESDLSLILSSNSNNNPTITSKTDEILYKHLTSLKQRINYLHPNTFSPLAIFRKYSNFYNSPFSTSYKGSNITIDINTLPTPSATLTASIYDPNPDILQPNDPFQAQLIRLDSSIPFDKYDQYDPRLIMLVQFSFNPVDIKNNNSNKGSSELWDINKRLIDGSSKYFIGIVPNTMSEERYNLSCEESQINEKDPTKVAFYGIGTFKDTIYLGGGRKTWDCAEDGLQGGNDDGGDNMDEDRKHDTKFEACVYGIDDESDDKIPTKPSIYKNDIVRMEINLQKKIIEYYVCRVDEMIEKGVGKEDGNSIKSNKLEEIEVEKLLFDKIGTIVLGGEVDITFKANQKIPKAYHPCVGLGEQGTCVKVMFI